MLPRVSCPPYRIAAAHYVYTSMHARPQDSLKEFDRRLLKRGHPKVIPGQQGCSTASVHLLVLQTVGTPQSLLTLDENVRHIDVLTADRHVADQVKWLQDARNYHFASRFMMTARMMTSPIQACTYMHTRMHATLRARAQIHIH